LSFPVILKLLNEDASIGISEFSVVKNFLQLKKQLNFLLRTYKQEIIIEEYIDGRELNVAVLNDIVLPISEIKFTGLPKGLPKIVTYDGKWISNSIYYENTKPKCPAILNKITKNKIEKIALESFEALNCRDYARVDIRLKDKSLYVVEVNPNPDISFDSGFARAASAAGISHQELLVTIANFALSRHQAFSRKKHDTETKAS
jgi:D-alanine-D-alanine ligase